jgi:two-component system chemotaxis response regulator CheB
MKALIIEDSAIDGTLLKRMLLSFGIESIIKKNALEACETLCADTSLTLVFIDITLNNESGFVVLETINKMSDRDRLRSVMFTSSNQMSDIQKSLSLGALEFIVKPISPAILRDKLTILGIPTSVAPSQTSEIENKVHNKSASPIPEKFKVLVVDDASTVRTILRKRINEDPRLTVVGAAPEGKTALEMIQHLKPDIITLDIEMPILDGMSTLKALKAAHVNVPVIMCSSLTTHGASIALEAMDLGASDYIAKPTSSVEGGQDWNSLGSELVDKLAALCEAQVSRSQTSVTPKPRATTSALHTSYDILLVGSSTGGPVALQKFLSTLAKNLTVPTVIVQHMPVLFTQLLAQRLSLQTGHDVREVKDKETLSPGVVYLAPGGFHIELRESKDSTQVITTQDPLKHGCRPSVDVCFSSLLTLSPKKALIVMLTGMGKDGAESTKLLHDRGATVIAQDKATSTVWGMPRAVVEAGAADYILPLDAIGIKVSELLHNKQESREYREA